MRNRIASVPVASVMVVSFSLLAVSPGLAQADLGGAPLDPYAAPRESGPLDPYAAASGPRMPPPVLLVAPPAPPPLQPAPVAPIDRYAAPGEYPPAAQYAPNPYAPGAGTCPAGCPQALPSLSTYHPTPPATERRPRYGLMSAGISIFTVSYVATASSAYYADRGELAIPLVGPIMTAIDLNRNDANRWDSAVPWRRAPSSSMRSCRPRASR